jgi:hypothetical protein
MAKPTTNSKIATKSTSHSLSNVTKTKGVNFYRDEKKVRKLEILKSGRAKRDKNGKITSQLFQSRLAPGTMARVEPNRRWFGTVVRKLISRKHSSGRPERIRRVSNFHSRKDERSLCLCLAHQTFAFGSSHGI